VCRRGADPERIVDDDTMIAGELLKISLRQSFSAVVVRAETSDCGATVAVRDDCDRFSFSVSDTDAATLRRSSAVVRRLAHSWGCAGDAGRRDMGPGAVVPERALTGILAALPAVPTEGIFA
jgi:hypothetical protein